MSDRFNPAQGEPWQVMYVNLFNTLLRSRACYPLRLTCKEVAESCLPTLDRKDWRAENLMQCVNFAPHVNFEIDEGRFYMVCDPDEVYPTPVRGEAGIMIPPTHPHYDAINKWYVEADEHEDFLTDARIYLNRMLKVLKHPVWVQKHWPEIVPYVGKIPDTMVKRMREPISRQVTHDYPLQDRIQNTLTAAALVSRDHDIKAWVGAYTRREV